MKNGVIGSWWVLGRWGGGDMGDMGRVMERALPRALADELEFEL